jgi:hypothetical protein
MQVPNEFARRDARGDTGLLQRRPVTANLKTLWLNWSYSCLFVIFRI